MGKKKTTGVYNDFLDGEKLHDNAEIRTSLQSSTRLTRQISPPPQPTHPNGPSSPNQMAGKARPKKGNQIPTHFLCLPLVTPTSHPQLSTSLSTLKSTLSQQTQPPTIPTSAIRPPSTLHLTLGVLNLTPSTLPPFLAHLQTTNLHSILRDITHAHAASLAAESGAVSENLIAGGMPDTEALTITLEGLKAMRDPCATSVLYAEAVDQSARLEEFAKKVRGLFVEAGWVKGEEREFKLHATVLNTIYAGKRGRGVGGGAEVDGEEKDGIKEQSTSVSSSSLVGTEYTPTSTPTQHHKRTRKSSKPLLFDARPLIEHHKHTIWATDIKIDRLCLCKMGARKIWSSGVQGVGEVVDEAYEVIAEQGIF
ncbi:hypothetical protein T440DRAFT_521130 [Plenodomus tracheiphilus IPT5]|uniref:A-kinase anchor protein 7-like phosphoesterase domain-containing protein n=1 Tax=Plenodomus tracheiphilus IPT5 TaxID=1408161 RepID=A0A6A7AXP2_9PLEO|nr:hypothetical protein T440DRAFT_521130 [Plenodomus tracheiphilus IPT5]